MREIKFEYIYSDGLNHIRKIFTLDEISNGDCYDVVSNSPLLARLVIVAKRQYTGLDDKNGKHIFEGDIVKDKDGEIYDVFYNERFTCFELRFTGNYVGFYNNTLSVIGNIYENPELL